MYTHFATFRIANTHINIIQLPPTDPAIYYYIKLRFPCVCLSVCLSVCLYPPPPFSTRLSDRNQTFDPPHPGGSRGGPVVFFRVSTNQKSGKCHELPGKSTHFLTPPPPKMERERGGRERKGRERGK